MAYENGYQQAHHHSTYQPLNPYQNYGNQGAGHDTSNSYSYQRYGGGGTSGPESGATSYGPYNTGRTSVDTTNLGNLAYASSLKTSASSSYQSRYSYATNNNDPSTQSQQGSDNGVANGTYWNGGGRPGETQPAYNSYQNTATSTNVNKGTYVPENRQQAPAQNSCASPNYQAQTRHAPNSRSPQYPARPISGQAIRRPLSTSSFTDQNPQPVTTSPYAISHTPSDDGRKTQPNLYAPTQSAQHSALPQSQSPQSSQRLLPAFPPPPAPVSSQPVTSRQTPQDQSIPRISGEGQMRRKSSPLNPRPSVSKVVQVENPAGTDQAHQHSQSNEIERPATVDPNQIFNHDEYQRRQDADAAKKKAELYRSEISKSKQSVPTGGKANSQSSIGQILDDKSTSERQGSRASTSSLAETESSKREQMELEMKKMLDKMREYKAHDPSLFSQIWEQVKKGQGLPNNAAQSLVAGASTSPIISKPQIPSPVESDLPLHQEAEAASTFPSGFDRGRFPYQRRRRGSLVNSTSRNFTSVREQAGSPRPAPAQKITSPGVGENESTTAIDPTDQRLLTAMQDFHRNLESQGRHGGTSSQIAQSTKANELPASSNSEPRTTPLNEGKVEQKSPIGKTVWPEHKKNALAEAAAKTLNFQSTRVGRPTSSAEIRRLLDQNPSYAQLCEHLERKGFVLDRSQFARFLLASVPELNSMVQRPPTAQTVPQSAAKSQSAPVATMSNGIALDSPTVRQNAVGFWTEGTVNAYKQSTTPSNKDPLNSNSSSTPAEPLTKQDKARKRNFSEIIDLSKDNSDSESQTNVKPRVREHPGQSNSHTPHTNLSVQSKGENHEKTTSPPNSGIPVQKDTIRTENVAQPLNYRRDALRRSTYDPRTIARDILISSGRHPTEAPLNSHLDGLRDKFEKINFYTDLTTLRWDLIDPASKGSEKKKSAAAALTHKKGEDVHVDRPRADWITFQRPPAPPQNNSTRRRGRPPKYPGSTAQQNPPISVSVPISAGTSIENKNGQNSVSLRDEAFAPMEFTQAVQLTNSSPKSSSKAPASSGDRSSIISSFSFTPGQPSSKRDDSTLSSPSGFTAINSKSPIVRIPGRKGRPPGAKNRFPRPDKGIPKSKPPAWQLSPQGIGEMQFTPQRTSALRNATSPSEFAVVVSSRSPSVSHQGDTTSQPFQRRASLKREDTSLLATPNAFGSYQCRWKDCPAELHDIETLHKHMRKHRARSECPLECQWDDCGVYSGPPGRERESITRLSFGDTDSWDKHINESHLLSLTGTSK